MHKSKVALKKAWTEAKEKGRTKLQENTSMQENGDYTAANDTGGAVADISYSTIKQNTDFTVQQGRKFSRKQIEKYRERRSAEQAESTLPVSAVSARNKPSAARCPMRRNARAVGQICPASGRKKKPSPPKPRRAIFAV